MAWTRIPGYILAARRRFRWLLRNVKDEDLTGQVKELEKQLRDDAGKSRKAVRELIEKKYTLPAENAGPR